MDMNADRHSFGKFRGGRAVREAACFAGPALLVALAVFMMCAGCGKRPAPLAQNKAVARARGAPVLNRDGYLVGAHYYIWYPGNMKSGALRRSLAPPQQSVLGNYRSFDAATIEQHLAWCSEFGIDFIAVDWWPRERRRNQTFMAALMAARNLGDTKFCIFYEAWSLNFDPVYGSTTFTNGVTDRFVRDITNIVETIGQHPAYLRVGGRPVIFLYLTRTFCGEYAQAMADIRAQLGEKGINPFIVGDEIFWKVAKDRTAEGLYVLPTTEPQTDRISLFDAITAYNCYEGGQLSHRGYGAASKHLEDVSGLYARYREAAGDVPIIPSVIPGYNDRGVRLRLDHYPIPRQWSQGRPEGTLFEQYIDRIGLPYCDKNLNMIMITSWNEWQEDTGIEPLSASPATTNDSSESGIAYTQGYSYSGHGMAYLDVVRNKFVAISGRVKDADGLPVRGKTICAWAGGRLLAKDVSDMNGCYTLSRLNLKPAQYEIGLEDGSSSRTTVVVKPDITSTNTDFYFLMR